ncbi:DUF1310 family protein [Bifidobacterium bombi]|uniref:Uncharacterized protein n=2 Tax=Bifidobacterium bombi TaxID=471511 RepID=A0A080N4T6_9BIFI|nr:DUF1310 family protein [Bifidobacterium bombi]KFF31705.1 hypothetical protein BBOMB_1092 [Bifidobacterium bombi DSM 19703]
MTAPSRFISKSSENYYNLYPAVSQTNAPQTTAPYASNAMSPYAYGPYPNPYPAEQATPPAYGHGRPARRKTRLQKTLTAIGICALAIILLFMEGRIVEHERSLHDAKYIAHSPEAIAIYEKDMKMLDPKALTKEGKIKTYRIDDDSVKWTPMGSITLIIIVNDNPELNFNEDLDRPYMGGERKPLKGSGPATSWELNHLVNPKEFPQEHAPVAPEDGTERSDQ